LPDELIGVYTDGYADLRFVQHLNHAPLARELARDAERVEWGGESSIAKAVEVLQERGAHADRIGVIGPMTFEQHTVLAARFGKVTSLNRAYAKLRLVQSIQEIAG